MVGWHLLASEIERERGRCGGKSLEVPTYLVRMNRREVKRSLMIKQLVSFDGLQSYDSLTQNRELSRAL